MCVVEQTVKNDMISSGVIVISLSELLLLHPFNSTSWKSNHGSIYFKSESSTSINFKSCFIPRHLQVNLPCVWKLGLTFWWAIFWGRTASPDCRWYPWHPWPRWRRSHGGIICEAAAWGGCRAGGAGFTTGDSQLVPWQNLGEGFWGG